jgi:TPR repeat protein
VTDREKIRFVNPYAYFTLGWCYRYGEGVPPLLDTSSTGDGKERRHYSEARRWFLRAAEHERQFQGTNSNETDSDKGIGQQQPVTIVGQAAWELGLMWWKGRGGERSQIEAWYWILRSVIVTASPSSSSRAMAEWRRQAIDWLEAHWIQFWKRHKPDFPSISAAVASTADAKENEGTGMKIAVGKTESEESENAGRTDREDGSDPSTRSAKIRAILHALRPEDFNWLTVWRQIYLMQWRNLQKEYWRQILHPESKEFAKYGDLDSSSIRYLQETLNQLEIELIMMMLHTIYVDNK